MIKFSLLAEAKLSSQVLELCPICCFCPPGLGYLLGLHFGEKCFFKKATSSLQACISSLAVEEHTPPCTVPFSKAAGPPQPVLLLAMCKFQFSGCRAGSWEGKWNLISTCKTELIVEVTARGINIEEGVVIFNGDSCFWPLPSALYTPGDLDTGRLHSITAPFQHHGQGCSDMGSLMEGTRRIFSRTRRMKCQCFIDHRTLRAGKRNDGPECLFSSKTETREKEVRNAWKGTKTQA